MVDTWAHHTLVVNGQSLRVFKNFSRLINGSLTESISFFPSLKQRIWSERDFPNLETALIPIPWCGIHVPAPQGLFSRRTCPGLHSSSAGSACKPGRPDQKQGSLMLEGYTASWLTASPFLTTHKKYPVDLFIHPKIIEGKLSHKGFL